MDKSILLIPTAFMLGLRHGIDWDHIVAISDITAFSNNYRQSFLYATLYFLGHGSIIVVLGIFAITLGINLPPSVDSLLEPIVGITLIGLGIWIIFQVLKQKKSYRPQSKWSIIFSPIKNTYKKLVRKRDKKIILNKPKVSSFLIGCIHAVGAETPTQVVLFLTASKIEGEVAGILLLVLFVFGLLISNSILALLSVLGYSKSKNHASIHVTLGMISGITSIIVGMLFLSQKSSLLPKLL